MTEGRPLDYADLATYAAWVLGSVEEATEWLAEPHPLLGDRPPVEVARTPEGYEQVMAILRRLEGSLPA